MLTYLMDSDVQLMEESKVVKLFNLWAVNLGFCSTKGTQTGLKYCQFATDLILSTNGALINPWHFYQA
jgi:hypothetical protein